MPRFNEGFTEARTQLEEQKKRVRDVSVTMVIPPSEFLANQRVFPFLGPLYVANQLRSNGNHVEVIDFSGIGNYEELMKRYAGERRDIGTFGITATTPQLPAAVRAMRAIREGNPEARVILGGTHATLTHSAMQQDLLVGRDGRGSRAFGQVVDLFDRVVVGDGEMAVFPAIDPLLTDKVIDAATRKSPFFIQRGELDTFGTPARDMIDEGSYSYEIDGHRAVSIIGQRGCPFKCGFCSGRHSDFLRLTRTRPVGHIVEEIEQVVEDSDRRRKPVTGVMFYDDELNVTDVSLEKLCEGLIDMQSRLGKEMRFRGFVKAERFNPRQAELMYKAGFRVLLTGVESGSEYILKVINKNTTPEVNSSCLKMAHDAGLAFKALMSIGHADESPKTLDQTRDWLRKHRPDDFDVTAITPYPGSDYYDRADYDDDKKAWLYREPRTGARLWSNDMDFMTRAIFYKGVVGSYACETFTPELTANQLTEYRDRLEVELRQELGLPPIQSIAARQFEHSMGQGLPGTILRVG